MLTNLLKGWSCKRQRDARYDGESDPGLEGANGKGFSRLLVTLNSLTIFNYLCL